MAGSERNEPGERLFTLPQLAEMSSNPWSEDVFHERLLLVAGVSDGNNKILASSELLTSKQGCHDAIAIVQGQAAFAPVYDKTAEVSVR